MRGFGRTQRGDDAGQSLCYRCRTPIALDGRAIEARSIVDGAEPALFHIGCAPPADSLRWHGHREIPMRVVRPESGVIGGTGST